MVPIHLVPIIFKDFFRMQYTHTFTHTFASNIQYNRDQCFQMGSIMAPYE